MAVPEETRVRLARWCRACVPAAERGHRLVGYAIHGDQVRIVARHAPAYPELSPAWTSTPLAELRRSDPRPGLWSLYRPGDEAGQWERLGEPAGDPFDLLDRVTADPGR